MASDPHLGPSIPSTWHLIGQHLSSGETFVGNSMPGTPSLMLGKHNNLTIGVTAVLADVSDLFKEKLNSDKT